MERDRAVKLESKATGSFGVNPHNSPVTFLKKPITIWLVERAPARPFSLGISISKKIPYGQSLNSPTVVDQFVRETVLSCPPFLEQKEIFSGALSIDDSRKAYI